MKHFRDWNSLWGQVMWCLHPWPPPWQSLLWRQYRQQELRWRLDFLNSVETVWSGLPFGTLTSLLYIWMVTSPKLTNSTICVLYWTAPPMMPFPGPTILDIIYTLPHSVMEPLVCQLRCSISECDKRFVTRPICNANICATQVDVTSKLLHSWWLAHVQSNNKTINVWLFM